MVSQRLSPFPSLVLPQNHNQDFFIGGADGLEESKHSISLVANKSHTEEPRAVLGSCRMQQSYTRNIGQAAAKREAGL